MLTESTLFSPVCADVHMASSPKRRRIDPEEDLRLEEDDEYVPYVPVAQRRQAKLAQLANRGQTHSTSVPKVSDEDAEREAREDAEREEEKRRERFRKERTLLQEAQEVHKRQAEEGKHTLRGHYESRHPGTDPRHSLDSSKTTAQKADEDEEKILAAIANQRKLASDLELAKGISYSESMKSTSVQSVGIC